MTEAFHVLLAWSAGCIMGAAYFGGLWWTVQRVVTSALPALWLVGSLVVRTVLVLAGFYFVCGPSWPRLVACLIGFIAARTVLTWLFGPVSTAHLEAPDAPGP